MVLMLSFQGANAQLGNVLKRAQGRLEQKAQDKLEQKANDAIDKTVNGSPKPVIDTKDATDATTNTTTGKKRITMGSAFDFKTGDSVIYSSKFEKFKVGALPTTWKTNGSGQLVKSKEIAGTWLELQNSATYKLNENYKLPDHFTIEFDILTSCDKITDINPVFFGFADNNSVSGWNEGDIAHTELQFYNYNKISSFANPVNKSINTDFELERFANDKMHVSIAVDNDQMRVFLDKTKILDSKMFKENVRKYFFISGPLETKNDAKVYVSNIVIAK